MRAGVEKEYDEILTTVKHAIEANYGANGDEVNDALDIVDLLEGGFETDFEKHIRLKNKAEEEKLKRI